VGAGLRALFQASVEGYVVGIDIEYGVVREACPELPADFVCGDVSTAPFRNESFTEALAFLTLHEVRGMSLSP